MIVVDTNILVYSTFEDSENHSKALEIIEKEDVKNSADSRL